jgi:hypothetical protein
MKFLVILFLISVATAHAQSGAGNGGDPREVQVHQLIEKIALFLDSKEVRDLNLFPEVQVSSVQKKLKDVKVKFVNRPLLDRFFHFRPLMNYPNQNRIRGNRRLWDRLQLDPTAQFVIVGHEVFGLLGIEVAGLFVPSQYDVSERLAQYVYKAADGTYHLSLNHSARLNQKMYLSLRSCAAKAVPATENCTDALVFSNLEREKTTYVRKMNLISHQSEGGSELKEKETDFWSDDYPAKRTDYRFYSKDKIMLVSEHDAIGAVKINEHYYVSSDADSIFRSSFKDCVDSERKPTGLDSVLHNCTILFPAVFPRIEACEVEVIANRSLLSDCVKLKRSAEWKGMNEAMQKFMDRKQKEEQQQFQRQQNQQQQQQQQPWWR